MTKTISTHSCGSLDCEDGIDEERWERLMEQCLTCEGRGRVGTEGPGK